jgi:hypothetical protein
MLKHPQTNVADVLRPKPWAEKELSTLQLGDQRLNKRARHVLADFAAQPQASIPQASGNVAASKAVYRLFSNQQVKPGAVVAAHRQASLERARGLAVVLAVQDTTTLNFSSHRQTQGLGPVSNNKDKTLGFFLHSTLLLEPSGLALGVIEAQVFARDPAQYKAGPAGARNRQPVAQKESHKWLRSLEATVRVAPELSGSTIINIADRESDSYDLFWRHAQLRAGLGESEGEESLEASAAQRVELLVRCQHNRQLNQQEERLFAHLAAQALAGEYDIIVPRQVGRKARAAKLSLRFAQVQVSPPPDQRKYQGHQEDLVLWAVEAREENPPPGQEAICWRLLSTLPVENAADAQEQVRRYSQRWEIELFHKILKSGCQAEQRQLESVARLERCLVFDVIVAVRVLSLSKAGRDAAGELPADRWLAPHQWQALWCRIHRQPHPPVTAPSTREATRWIAQLGGFLARKGDGHPGPITLWRGLQRLNDIAEAYLLFTGSKDVGNV